ncbi:MAG: hypothetical protein FWG77_02085 [Treponema sp.]|nr:hypothetical protein [Treponema sp.]
MKRYFALLFLSFFLISPSIYSDDAEVAERYALWALDMINRDLWSEAHAGLERAFDFADVSSDISYLLAITRSNRSLGRETVLEALEYALQVDSWTIFRSEDARLLKAEYLIDLMEYHWALAELSLIEESLRKAELTLRALSKSRPIEFRNYLERTLDLYPREPWPVRIFFNHINYRVSVGSNPEPGDIDLIYLIIRRLPVLLPLDPELAWMIAPFISDIDEARQLIMSYRALGYPVPDSIPIALSLGVIDEETALAELFSANAVLDLALIGEVWELLRHDDARAIFERNLSSYSGVIIEDINRDGIPETIVQYAAGIPIVSFYDNAQRGVNDMTIFFEAGIPIRSIVLVLPENLEREATVYWERYPAVLMTEFGGALYTPRPLDFFFTPIQFTELWNTGVLFPRRDLLAAPLNRRALVFYSLTIERPSEEFRTGIEIVELINGIPIRAREYVGNLMVSETTYVRGRPQSQRVDLDFDGRMETLRYFRQDNRPLDIDELLDLRVEIEHVITE